MPKKRKDYSEDQKSIASDLDVASALEAVALSEGGKIIVSGLLKDVVSAAETLSAKHQTLTLQEFIGICADMKSKLDLIRVISRSKKNKSYLQGLLEEAIAKEAEGEDEEG